MQPGVFGSGLYESVIISSKNMQPITRTGTTGKTHQKINEIHKGFFSFRLFSFSNPVFPIKDELGKPAHRSLDIY